MSRRAALNYKALLPEDVPDFAPPRFNPREIAAEHLLETFRQASEEALAQGTKRLRAFEDALQAVLVLAEEVVRTGGLPEIEELIDLTGDHREKVSREVEPRIEEGLKSRRGVAASKNPKMRAVIPPLIDQNIQLMRDYLRLIDQLYDRLLLLRDDSIRQSFATLSADVLAGMTC